MFEHSIALYNVGLIITICTVIKYMLDSYSKFLCTQFITVTIAAGYLKKIKNSFNCRHYVLRLEIN